MPRVVSMQGDAYKARIPDKKVELELTDDEMEKFFEVYPDALQAKNPPADSPYHPAKITVRVTIEAFKK